MRVARIDKATASRWITQKHYRRTLGIFWEAFALIDNYKIEGVVCYGQPSPPIQKHSFKDRDFRLYELTRLVVQTPAKNAASFLIANSLKQLRERPSAVISYADGAVNHCGIVYQATNWLYTGAVKAHDKFYVVGGEKLHPMTVRDRFKVSNPTAWAKANNIEMVRPEPKHRYFYLNGSKTDKKKMREQLKYNIVPNYPKTEKSMYDAGPDIFDLSTDFPL
jgi:hypothetical protein